jgi:hypothetical protein
MKIKRKTQEVKKVVNPATELTLYFLYFLGYFLVSIYIFSDFWEVTKGFSKAINGTLFAVYLLIMIIVVFIAARIYGFNESNKYVMYWFYITLIGQVIFISVCFFSDSVSLTVNQAFTIYTVLWGLTHLVMVYNTRVKNK